jgi:hypothetical protein
MPYMIMIGFRSGLYNAHYCSLGIMRAMRLNMQSELSRRAHFPLLAIQYID